MSVQPIDSRSTTCYDGAADRHGDAPRLPLSGTSPAARAGMNPSSAGAIDSEPAQATVGAVHQESTATLPTSTDLIQPA